MSGFRKLLLYLNLPLSGAGGPGEFPFLAASALLWLAAAGAAIAVDFPQGTFALKGPRESLWTVQFDGQGKFTVSVGGKEQVTGTYKAAGDQVEFRDEAGPIADKDAGPGKYRWKLDGDKLTFTKLKDQSEGRAGDLTFGPWVRKAE